MLSRILLTLGAGMLLLAGCGSRDGTGSDESGAVQVYEVSGVIARLPEGAGTELMIEHEEIPDFVNAQGDTVGMNAMTMGFPPAEGLELEDLAPGDSVRFTFEVRWGGSPPLKLTHVEKG